MPTFRFLAAPVNKIFDPSTPSMRKSRDGGENPPGKTHRLLNPKWPTGLGNRSTPRLLEPLINLHKFFDSILPSMRTSKIQNGCQGGQNVFGRSRQLLLSKFFDPSTPFMTKVGNGGEEHREKNSAVYSGHKHHCQLADRLEC